MADQYYTPETVDLDLGDEPADEKDEQPEDQDADNEDLRDPDPDNAAQDGEEVKGDADEGSEESASDDESEDESEGDEDSAPGTIRVMLPGENGDEEHELTAEQIRAGFMFQRTFTQKTEQLKRERQEMQAQTQQQVKQAQDAYLQSLVQTQHMLNHVAGIPSEHDMQRLAVEDAQGWMQAQRRLMQAQQAHQRIAHEIQQIEHQRRQQEEAELAERYEQAWIELQASGYDRDKLQRTYAKAQELFGIKPETFGQIYDPGLVKALGRAVAAQTPAKPDKSKRFAQKAMRTNKARNPQSQQSRQERDRAGRFTAKEATLDDLAESLKW